MDDRPRRKRYRVILAGDNEKVLYDGYNLEEAQRVFDATKASYANG